MDVSEKWGTSIEEAVKLALLDLKLTEDEVVVTVLEEPSKGFFGIGSKLAKVRVEKKKEEKKEEEKKEEIREQKEEVKASKKEEKAAEKNTKQPADRKVKEEKRNEKESLKEEKEETEEKTESGKKSSQKSKLSLRVRPDDLVEVEDHLARTFLNEVCDKMGLSVSMKVFANKDCVFVDMEGKDSGTIIGKRGQTLDAIQYLTSLVVNKDSEEYIRVVIDAENYREKREHTLEQLANRLADKVMKTGKNVRLEPMNPYERKVIHAALQGRKGIYTRSEGEEPYRRVVIERR